MTINPVIEMTADVRMGPYTGAAAVTPDDSNDLPISGRGIMLGSAGNVKITTTGGDTVTLVGTNTFPGVYPICVKRVFATGTTAVSIVVFW